MAEIVLPRKPYYADQSLGARITRQVVFGLAGTAVLFIGVGCIYNGFREAMPFAVARRDELAMKHFNQKTEQFVADRQYREWYNSPEQVAARAERKAQEEAERDRKVAKAVKNWATWFMCKGEYTPNGDGTYREEWCTAPWNMK